MSKKKTLKEFLTLLDTSNSIDKATVNKIDLRLDNLITGKYPLNMFTTLPTTHMVTKVRDVLKNELSTVCSNEGVLTLEEYAKKIEALGLYVSNIDKWMKAIVLDKTIVDNIVNNKALFYFIGEGGDTLMVDAVESNLEIIVTQQTEMLLSFVDDSEFEIELLRLKKFFETTLLPAVLGRSRCESLGALIEWFVEDYTFGIRDALVMYEDDIMTLNPKDGFRNDVLLNTPANQANLQIIKVLSLLLKAK